MTINKLAIIGGSGLYDVEEFKDRELLDINTPWGKPSDQILKTNYHNKEVFFLPRHGRGHYISPTNINFRANIDALKQLGVTDIISVSAVGSLKEDLPPGKFVIVDQFIDRTFARKKTFFDDEIVAHVSMAYPTSNGLMNACEDAIKKEKNPRDAPAIFSLAALALLLGAACMYAWRDKIRCALPRPQRIARTPDIKRRAKRLAAVGHGGTVLVCVTMRSVEASKFLTKACV